MTRDPLYDLRLYQNHRIGAGALKQLLAFILDLIILNLLTLPLQVISMGLVPIQDGKLIEISQAYLLLQNSQALYLAFILVSILAFAYFTVFEYLGSTIGEQIIRLKVISIKGDLSLSQCFIRNLFALTILPFILLWIIDPITLLFNKKRQRLTEMLSGTMTVDSSTSLYSVR